MFAVHLALSRKPIRQTSSTLNIFCGFGSVDTFPKIVSSSGMGLFFIMEG